MEKIVKYKTYVVIILQKIYNCKKPNIIIFGNETSFLVIELHIFISNYQTKSISIHILLFKKQFHNH